VEDIFQHVCIRLYMYEKTTHMGLRVRSTLLHLFCSILFNGFSFVIVCFSVLSFWRKRGTKTKNGGDSIHSGNRNRQRHSHHYDSSALETYGRFLSMPYQCSRVPNLCNPMPGRNDAIKLVLGIQMMMIHPEHSYRHFPSFIRSAQFIHTQA
jgi:hypothetical protein